MAVETFDYSIVLNSTSLDRLKLVNDIIKDYAEQGYRLTLRQLYYQLVTRKHIENKQTEYNRLSTLLSKGRLMGKVDWDAIEDRIRQPKLPYWVVDPEEAIKNTVNTYRLDRMLKQPEYIEVWTEKDALSGVLYPITQKYHIRLLVNRGYSSVTAIYDGFNRFYPYLQMGVPIRVIYMGDHDPSGVDMVRDIEDRLLTMMSGERIMENFTNDLNTYTLSEEFDEDRELLKNDERFNIRTGRGQFLFHATKAYMKRFLTVDAIALTLDQIEQYALPPDPAKVTDPRAKEYIAKYGETSWELDALPPNVLSAILKDRLIEVVDQDKMQEILKQEKIDKCKLNKLTEQL